MDTITDRAVAAGNPTFPVVGIGASAGGVSALLRFLENMPAGNGMAFVFVLHLSPSHESAADLILQKATRMPVIQVSEKVRIAADTVYVIAPDKDIEMQDGHLTVRPQSRPIGHHVAIDIFFRALAAAHSERAFAIILTGTGQDGSVGIARIKEQGGVTMAQSVQDAEYDGMPDAAIRTGMVDFILPVAEMPQKLIELWSNARAIQLPPISEASLMVVAPSAATELAQAEEAISKIITLLRVRTGHDFRHYKRATMLRRIERRLQVRVLPTLSDYCKLLEADADEPNLLLKDMLIGVTNFFRDREAFDTLERDIVVDLCKSRRADETLRIWVAGCSTGEEAYSMAMLFQDNLSTQASAPLLQIFASDIDEAAIATARSGQYPTAIVTDVSPARLRHFFVKNNERYQVKKSIRDKIMFASHNLLRDPPFSKLDVVTCRNLLIYLNRDVQAHVLEMFHFALNPGGILFLGSSESAEATSYLFEPVDKKSRIYRARPMARSTRYTPPLARSGAGAGRVIDFGTIKTTNQPRISYGEIHQRILVQYAPPSMVLSHESNIVHMSDRAGRFLRHVGGEPSRNVLALILPGLRLELRTALFTAEKSGRTVETVHQKIIRENKTFSVAMTVRPFHDDDVNADFVLVLFDEREEAPGGEVAPVIERDSVLAQMEEELQRSKEQLQETVEHSGLANEELRASNEELQAINEELRSASEELETSKEELQSINEELITVNYELKVKVEETGKINDDLNNLIASTDIATIFLDSSLRIKRFTPEATDIFSIIAADIGRPLFDITHKLDYPHLANDASSTFDSLQPVEREVRHADGRYFIVRLLPYRTTDDRIDGAVLTFIDITKRRDAENKLRLGQERMRLVAESTRDYAILTLDLEGRITSWNTGAERMFGHQEADILGQPLEVIFVPEDRQAGAPEEEMRGAREKGRYEDERWHLHKDGTRLYCSGITTPLGDSPPLRGYAKIARDETDRIVESAQREEALKTEHSIRRTIETASAAKDEFFAVMSHELRHPLNLIHINTELLARLKEVTQSPLGFKAISSIRHSVMSQAKIIEDLLDLSRFHTGKLTLSKMDIDLIGVVEEIVGVLKQDIVATGLWISVEHASLPIMVQADVVRIEQVLMNLINNAMKFTPEGGTVRVVVSSENGFGRLDVIDSGTGIAADQLGKVFDMFGQVGAATARSKGGLGIGLALVRQIVELHGGRVQADSAGLGAGAQFTLWLPLAAHDAGAGAGPGPKGDGLFMQRALHGVRVLLVDDSVDLADSFQALLEMEGAVAQVCSSAYDALLMLEQETVDILISDVSMPDLDGYDFIRQVRDNGKCAAMPAIALSGMGRPEDAKRALDAGFHLFLSKPVAIDHLIMAVLKLCGR